MPPMLAAGRASGERGLGPRLAHADARVHHGRASLQHDDRVAVHLHDGRMLGRQRRDPEDDVLEGVDVLGRVAAEPVQQREASRATRIISLASRSVSGATRMATSRVSSTMTPPAPAATTGPNTGSAAMPTSISTPPESISCSEEALERLARRHHTGPHRLRLRGHLRGVEAERHGAALGLVERAHRLQRDLPVEPRRGLRGLLRSCVPAPRERSGCRSTRSRRSISCGSSHPSPRSSAVAMTAVASSSRIPGNSGTVPSGFSRQVPRSAACASAIAACSGNGYEGMRTPGRREPVGEAAGGHEAREDGDPSVERADRLHHMPRDVRRVGLDRRDVDHDQRVDARIRGHRADRVSVILAGGRRDHVHRVGDARGRREEGPELGDGRLARARARAARAPRRCRRTGSRGRPRS